MSLIWTALFLTGFSILLLTGRYWTLRSRTSLRPTGSKAAHRIRGLLQEAAEDGRPLHLSPGNADLMPAGPTTLDALLGLTVVNRLSRWGSEGGSQTAVTTGGGWVQSLARSAEPDRKKGPAALLLAQNDPLTYALGAAGHLSHAPAGNVVIGPLGPEAALLGEMAERQKAPQCWALTAPEGMPLLPLYDEEGSLGEGAYATGAHVQGDPRVYLRLLDVVRWLIALGVLVGALIQLVLLLVR